MACRYKITPLAMSDIDEAMDYIAGKLRNSQAADSLYHAILKEISGICDHPYAFPDCSYYLIDDENIRHSKVGSYILVYEISPEEEIIKILRFPYGRRDIAGMKIGQ